MGGACNTHDILAIHTQFWSENLMGNDHLGDVDLDGRIILKWVFWKCVKMWTGFIWIGIGFSGRLLQTRYLTFAFHKRREFLNKLIQTEKVKL
jgi:hypothetical protein